MGKKRRGVSPSLEDLQAEMSKLKQSITNKLKRRKKKDDDEVEDEITEQGDETVEPVGLMSSTDSSSESDSEVDKERSNEREDENKENEAANGQKDAEILEKTDSAHADEFVELDDETLRILSDDEELDYKQCLLHPKLASTWKKILLKGLKKEKKTELLSKYPREGDGLFITPKLNLEVEACINDTCKKKDGFLAADMDLCGAGLSALGSGISMIFESSVKEVNTKDLLTKLIEAGKLICGLQNELMKARKAFLYQKVDGKIRPILEKAETGEFLFGPDLSQKIKAAQAVQKLGISIKQVTTGKRTVFQASSSLNWRCPPVRGRQGQAGRGRSSGYPRGAVQHRTQAQGGNLAQQTYRPQASPIVPNVSASKK